MILSENTLLIKTYFRKYSFRIAAIAGIVTLYFLPSDGLDTIVCWFQTLFKLPCPACGLTRAMSSLMQLQFYNSFQFHPLAALVLMYLFILAFSNQPDYIKSAVKKEYPAMAFLVSFKFIAFLFIIIWLFKMAHIYTTT